MWITLILKYWKLLVVGVLLLALSVQTYRIKELKHDIEKIHQEQLEKDRDVLQKRSDINTRRPDATGVVSLLKDGKF